MAKGMIEIDEDGISDVTKSMMMGLLQGNQRVVKSERKRGDTTIKLQMADPYSTDVTELSSELSKSGRKKGPKVGEDRPDEEPMTLTKSILNVLNGPGKQSIERLAFESDPRQNNTFASVYKSKLKLVPDVILKRIAIQDDLVAAIVNTRAQQIQSFGRPQPDRFSTGFKIVPDQGKMDKMDEASRLKMEARIDAVQKQLVTCGPSEGWKDLDRCTFAQYLGMSTRNAVTVGRLATEIIWGDDAVSGKKVFQGFRAIDAGTILRAAPHESAADSVRTEALHLLETLKNKDLQPERFRKNEYAWVQVQDGKPLQAFTEDECVVHNFYPVADIELGGYPVTPIDTSMAAVTTHINITTHNKLYFQSGRAARGMLVIKSDDVSEDTITRIKHQFQASINNVANAWRMPVFAVGADDEINWQAIDSGARDMEFQYLSDTNARVIMSAFQISPEELPGYQHLSRGTNNQALSEGNNEYKLEAARDVGIRPLIANFEDFLNARILPLLDKELAEFCVIKFMGLDAETPEKENVGLQEAMGVWMNYDDVHERVEKEPVGKQWAGQIPLNALWGQKLDALYTVGEILEYWCGREGASKKPELNYRRDPFWFQQQQLMQSQQQLDQQAQQQQAEAAAQQPQGDPNAQQPQGGELSSGLDQVIGMLSKSEAQLPPRQRRLLEQHRLTVDKAMSSMEIDLQNLSAQILDHVSDLPKKR
jgi:hypothetical protein